MSNNLKNNSKIIKKILTKVRPYINEEDKYNVKVVGINKGNSMSQNYCILIKNTPKFFAKVYDKRIPSTSQLRKISKQTNAFLYPIVDFSVGKMRCMITEYIIGNELSYTKSQAYQVAEILKSIHSQGCNSIFQRNNIKRELFSSLSYLMIHKVNFTGKRDVISYLMKNVSLCRKNYSFTHMDVHCKNFIVDSNNNIYLIDYENLLITDPWRDFIYACFFHDKEETVFWETVLQCYFNNNIPEDFWLTMKYYGYMHILRMVICEHKKANYKNINELSNKWFRSIEKHY